MALQTPNIFYINDIIFKINEYIKDDNNLLNCNKYLNELKLKNYKLNIEYSLHHFAFQTPININVFLNNSLCFCKYL